MKQLRLAFLVFASALGVAHAQDDEQRRAPPTEIPDFSNLDEYIYEPQSTVTFGMRRLSGAKTSFSGKGLIKAPEDPGAATGANLLRKYHDGTVNPDSRVQPRLDSSGNPLTDPANGAQIFDPIAPDGRTNFWNLSDPRQLTALEGYVAFHSYSADVVDTTVRTQEGKSSFGMELAMSRDMGRVFNTRMTWVVTAGISLNDLSSSRNDTVQANLKTITDYYSLFGQTVPTPPYTAPSSSSTPVLDASGNPVFDASGVAQTVTTDTTVLIGNQPAARVETIVSNSTSVSNRWKLSGAYYTFRAGPTVWIPIFSRLRFSVSAGAALVFAGTNYQVTQSFLPEIGEEITNTTSSDAYKLLPGYYAEAALQFDLTDRAGFYAGAVYQSTGSYTQNLNSDTAQYQTKIDLGSQSGLRAGMTVRF